MVTRAPSNHFSTCDSMTVTILKLRRKNSWSLNPYSVSSQPMLVTNPRYPPGIEEVGGMAEEVGVYIRPTGQHRLARPLFAKQLGVVGLLDPADALLPDVGWVANDCVHFLQGNTPHRVACQGYVVQGNASLRVEEAGPGNAGVVRLVAKVTDGEVYCG